MTAKIGGETIENQKRLENGCEQLRLHSDRRKEKNTKKRLGMIGRKTIPLQGKSRTKLLFKGPPP